MPPQGRDVLLVVTGHDGAGSDVHAPQERTEGPAGHHQLAVGETDVLRQFLAASGEVDPHHSGTGERGSADQEQVFGYVLQHHAHVEGTPGVPVPKQPVSTQHTLVDELAPGPLAVLEEQPGMAVASPGQYQAGGGHRRIDAHGTSGGGTADPES